MILVTSLDSFAIDYGTNVNKRKEDEINRDVQEERENKAL